MRILIIRVSAIGDVIHTLPSLFLLRECLPQAHISWIVQEKASALIKAQPFLDNVWVIPDNFVSPCRWGQTLSALRPAREHTWDAIIDFQGLIKTSLLVALLRGTKFGFARPHTREGISSYFTRHHTTPHYRNIIQKNLALTADVISFLAAPSHSPTIQELKKKFYLAIPDINQHTVTTWRSEKKINRMVLVCPNTTWPSKHWPLQRWQEFLMKFTQTYAHHEVACVMVGQHFGQQAAQLAHFIKEHQLPVEILPAWDLITVAHLVKQADVIIAPDTGILHLADFLGTHTIGIFGPTHKDMHGPFLAKTNQENSFQVNCPHYRRTTHASSKTSPSTYDCLEQLEAATVMTMIQKILTTHEGNQP